MEEINDSHLSGVSAVEDECRKLGITVSISLGNNGINIKRTDGIPCGFLELVYVRARHKFNKELEWSNSKQKNLKPTKVIISKCERPRKDIIKKLHRKLWSNFYQWKSGRSGSLDFEPIIGCSKEEFKSYINSQFTGTMTFDNCGEWHHDHIVPLSKAWQSKIESIDEQRQLLLSLWNYKNIRPLPKWENLRKGGWHQYKK